MTIQNPYDRCTDLTETVVASWCNGVEEDTNKHFCFTFHLPRENCWSIKQGLHMVRLSPLTSRKHQLRVHCAETLGTPIVGDYKYGWRAHIHFPLSNIKKNANEKLPKTKTLPFNLDFENGSISEKQPNLHLHCKQMTLPNVSQALQKSEAIFRL